MLQDVKKILPFIVIAATLAIAIALAAGTYYINYWPTDSYTPYTSTATRLLTKPFFSQMHEIPSDGVLRLTMHGKEALVVAIAVMQRILGDLKSLFPNVLVLIIAMAVSAIALYFILKELFDPWIGFIGYLLFGFCFWPYLYILQGAHQPLALMNLMLALACLLYDRGRSNVYFLSGLFLGAMFFSSPTATLFFAYYTGAFFYKVFGARSGRLKGRTLLLNIALLLAGMACIFLVFTIPDPANNIKGFLRFLRFSQSGNNFVLYKNYLQYLGFAMPSELRGGGLLWIWKYFLLIMPVMFPLYLAGNLVLLFRARRDPRWLLIILLGLSSPLAVEVSRVAQFGRNYYPWMIGMLLVIASALFVIRGYWETARPRWKTAGCLLLIIALSGHVIFNVRTFLADVFPARMATTRVHDWLIAHGQDSVYVYYQHPRNINFTWFLNNPKSKKKIELIPIRNIREALHGYILVPPITGKSILQECRLPDFSSDTYLTELYYAGKLDRYAAAAFPSLASSKIWTQEEEICTYLDLIQRGISAEDRRKGQVFLLDADKLQNEWFIHFPKVLRLQYPETGNDRPWEAP